MRVLLCAIVALPLVLFGVESAENVNNANTINQQTLDSNKSDKGDSKDTKDAKDSLDSSTESSVESPKNSLDSQSITKEESGLMLGIGAIMGGPIGSATSTLGKTLGTSQKRFDYGLEVLLGHKTFFGDGLFGMRLYIDYNYRKSRGVEMTSHILGLNVDTLWNFTQGEVFKIGMLVGVRSGIGFGRFNGCIVYYGEEYCGGNLDIEWSADLNIGVRFVIYDHNAFELLLQPRFGLGVLKGKNGMYGIVRYVFTF